METETNNDEQSSSTFPAKSRTKERARTHITPIDTDINDPENLDYEDIDDNHQIKQQTNPLKQTNDDIKSPLPIQNDENEVSHNNQGTASDEGELDEADLEDGEIHDPSASKNKSSTADEQNHSGVPSSPQAKVHCRFFLQGRCHWGPNCKYIHPNNDSAKSGIATDGVSSTMNETSPPASATISVPPTTTGNPWISPQAVTAPSQFFPSSLLRGQLPPAGLPLALPTGTESAWERGLRSAKALREQSMRRKQQDKDFNDKKFNLTIRDTLDEKETDDNLLNVNRPSSIDYDLDHLSGSNYPDQHGFSDRFHPYMYSGSGGNSHFNNHHRMNNNVRHANHNSSSNDHPDRRARHTDDYNDSRNDNRTRKEKSSVKDTKSLPKRDEGSSYKRNSSQQQYPPGSHHNNDEHVHPNQYHNRRADDWHDPWDRSRNHGGGTTRRPSRGGQGPSYSSSSASSSSSSRSTRSRSHSTSSSSRSRSRSRSRPKRRSPSVTRANKPLPTSKSSETVKNGTDKKSNGNKRLVSPSSSAAATNKFLPGRQISSHTLKKAEKSSNSSNSLANSHSKDPRAKDSQKKVKKSTKKENINRSNSTSSSSSSDSDGHPGTHRSSTSSSGSSSSENDTRPPTKTKTAPSGSKPSTGNSSHTKQPVNRQLSSSTSVGNKNPKSKNDLTTRETSTKKRRDTSSSTSSANATKKSKLNTDSQKSSTDASNAENSDSSKKKDTQKLLKKLHAVEKLINQRSTKASS